MASLVKSKVSDVVHGRTGSSADGLDDEAEANKYMLLVTAGPSYDQSTHQTVHVNGSKSVAFENKFMNVKVKVRIRDHRGLPKGSPENSPYFDDPVHEKDRYSVAFSFVPKVNIPHQDVVWGNDFDHPIRDRLPPGFNTALNIVKQFIDPGITCDAYADQPYLYTPALCGWDAFRIGDRISPDQWKHIFEGEPDVLTDGADGSGVEVREKSGMPDSREKRRKFFVSKENQAKVEFEAGRLYQGDFFNPYLDFGSKMQQQSPEINILLKVTTDFALRLPGFSLSVVKYVNDKTHHLQYVFKNLVTGDVYFVVVLKLLFGEELQRALGES
ncbi:hypothetical protein LTS18_005769 [Coniosporium uncinatum]|uniref:Uncharacterized protein n=1 Tax=Coniosporium uncinatum TaxID=93489 RepID=A0ACC3DB90_9PEZI|nr:hypothetical protein LTS18_005769 [Coniosporium uncinatum]